MGDRSSGRSDRRRATLTLCVAGPCEGRGSPLRREYPMSYTSHVDPFARQNLPPRELWPDFIFELLELSYPDRMNCATELLDRAVDRGWGRRVAIVAADGLRWTYAELLARANRIAQVLVDDLELVPGNRVLLHGPNNPMLAACWFAVMKAGGIAVATMPLLRAKELTDIVTKAAITHALCDARLADELTAALPACPTLAHIAYFNAGGLDGVEARMQDKAATFADVLTAADETCLIAFTSGTTGKPKGTMHFHRDVLAACDCWPQSTLRARADDLVSGSPPLAFTFGLGGLLLFPLRIGAATLLLEKSPPDALLAAIAKYRVGVLVTAPTSYRAMATQAEQFDLSSLHKCVAAGEALPARPRKPAPGHPPCVMEDAGQPLPAGRIGRLAVKGPTGCRYLSDERQKDYVKAGWHYTGDAYSIDEDGHFVYRARTDDMIISAGYNIAGPEVEDVLLLHPAVAECGVIGAPDEQRGQVVKAFVALKAGHVGDPAMVHELQEFVKRAIAPYKYPRAIEFMESLPRTETGKLQRFRLRQLELAQAPQRP